MIILEFIAAVIVLVAALGSVVLWCLWDSLDARDKWSIKDNLEKFLVSRGIK